MKEAVKVAAASAIGGSSLGLASVATSFLAGVDAATITRIVLGVEGVWFGAIGLVSAAILAFSDD